MDNRQDMTHTREIDLLELLMTVLIHWRSMIVVMMCGVIVLGGMSYIKSVQNIQNIQSRNEKLQQEEQYFNELSGKSEAELRELFAEKMTEEEITNVENAFLYEQQHNAKKHYLETSEFMQADSLHMYIADLIYQVDALDMAQAYSIRDVYANLLNSGEMRSRLETICNNSVDTLLFIAGDDDTVDLHNSNVLHVQIEYVDADMCDALARDVMNYIVEKHTEISASVGEHEINLIGQSYAEVNDLDLLDSQKDLKTDMINLRTSEAKLTKDFSADQKKYFDLLCMQEQKNVEKTSDQTQNISLSAPAISKKYMLMGAILFVLAYAGVLCLKCVANNRVQIKDDLQDLFGIPQLGLITKKEEKKRVFSFIDELIMRMYYHNCRRFNRTEATELAAVAVHMAVEKNSLNTVYFVGTGMDENTHQFCDVLQKELQASGIEVIVAENILYNAENLKKLEKANGAVLIETIGKTMYTEILQELQLLDRQQIKVLGGIMVEE